MCCKSPGKIWSPRNRMAKSQSTPRQSTLAMNFWWSPLFRTWMTAAWRITCALVSNHRLPQVASLSNEFWLFIPLTNWKKCFTASTATIPASATKIWNIMINLITSFCNLPHKNSNIPKPPTLWWCEKLWTNPMSRCCCPTTRRKQFRCVHLVACRPMVQHSSAQRRLRKPSLFESKDSRQRSCDKSSWTEAMTIVGFCWQKATFNTWCDNLWIGCSGSDGWSDTLEDLSNWGTEIRAKRHYSVRNIRIIVWRLLQRDTSLYAKLENMKNRCHKFSAVKAR